MTTEFSTTTTHSAPSCISPADMLPLLCAKTTDEWSVCYGTQSRLFSEISLIISLCVIPVICDEKVFAKDTPVRLRLQLLLTAFSPLALLSMRCVLAEARWDRTLGCRQEDSGENQKTPLCQLYQTLWQRSIINAFVLPLVSDGI